MHLAKVNDLFTIYIPKFCLEEQRYILDIVFGEFFGLNFEVCEYGELNIKITHSSCDSLLSVNADFFQKAAKNWLLPQSMPVLPLMDWTPENDDIHSSLVHQSIPVLYGQPGLVKNQNSWHLNIDIFGSAFFMLSRYEELISKGRDDHDRFPSWASIAHNGGFLDRPIVNEYIEILWSCMHDLWPELARKKRKFRKLVSCDVDHPFDLAGYSFKKTVLRVGARLLRDRNLKLAFYDGANYVFKWFGSDRFDEYRNNIDWMMEVNSAISNTVAFYFIPIQTNSLKEEANDVRSNKLAKLVKHIMDAGHEVGLHPGYDTYKHPENFKKSANALKEVFENDKLDFVNIGGRQHYLRYDAATTPQMWEENDLSYDSSLVFADRAGFRCGICYEYSMYDLVHRHKMRLKQRPLIVMDCSIISQAYEGLGFSQQSSDRIEYFKNVCKTFNGDFTLLWHNSYFVQLGSKNSYVNSIK